MLRNPEQMMMVVMMMILIKQGNYCPPTRGAPPGSSALTGGFNHRTRAIRGFHRALEVPATNTHTPWRLIRNPVCLGSR